MSLSDLRAKYEEMRALRLTDDGSYDPRARMAALAARFPGALREIDTLPLDEIEHRIEALTHAEQDPSRTSQWMRAQSSFHALTRKALQARLQANRLAGSEGAQSPFAEARSAEGELEGNALEREREQENKQTNLMQQVYEHLARELAVTPLEAKQLVFFRSRRT